MATAAWALWTTEAARAIIGGTIASETQLERAAEQVTSLVESLTGRVQVRRAMPPFRHVAAPAIVLPENWDPYPDVLSVHYASTPAQYAGLPATWTRIQFIYDPERRTVYPQENVAPLAAYAGGPSLANLYITGTAGILDSQLSDMSVSAAQPNREAWADLFSAGEDMLRIVWDRRGGSGVVLASDNLSTAEGSSIKWLDKWPQHIQDVLDAHSRLVDPEEEEAADAPPHAIRSIPLARG